VCGSASARGRGRRVRGARSDRGDAGLRARIERLSGENARLRGQLEEARRAGKRQAAPFSKGEPKQDPARPGRRSGEDYGTRAHRSIPDHVDQEILVGLPDACPCCRGELEFEDEVDQYQEEIRWVRGHVRRFRISRGRCRRCGRRAQGRHPDQTSDAVGAAGSQIGPRAVAIAAQLNKELGVAMSKVAQILELMGVAVTPGGPP
jgi:transposase